MCGPRSCPGNYKLISDLPGLTEKFERAFFESIEKIFDEKTQGSTMNNWNLGQCDQPN